MKNQLNATLFVVSVAVCGAIKKVMIVREPSSGHAISRVTREVVAGGVPLLSITHVRADKLCELVNLSECAQ